jgi:hypothetical protein
MATIGEPLVLACTAKQMRRIRGSMYARYAFRFTQHDRVIYESEQSAAWTQVAIPSP